MGDLLTAIADGLARFAEVADADRLADPTREALALMPAMVRPRQPTSPLLLELSTAGFVGATQMIQPTEITGGTIAFPGFTADDPRLGQ